MKKTPGLLLGFLFGVLGTASIAAVAMGYDRKTTESGQTFLDNMNADSARKENLHQVARYNGVVDIASAALMNGKTFAVSGKAYGLEKELPVYLQRLGGTPAIGGHADLVITMRGWMGHAPGDNVEVPSADFTFTYGGKTIKTSYAVGSPRNAMDPFLHQLFPQAKQRQ